MKFTRKQLEMIRFALNAHIESLQCETNPPIPIEDHISVLWEYQALYDEIDSLILKE